MQDKQSVLFTRPADRQQEARGKVVIHLPSNLHIMAYAAKEISVGNKATRVIRAFLLRAFYDENTVTSDKTSVRIKPF